MSEYSFLMALVAIFTVVLAIMLLGGPRLLEFAEDAIALFASFLGSSLPDCIDLEVNFDEFTLVNKEGSMVTLIEIQGTKKVVGAAETAGRVEALTQLLSSYFQKPGHSIAMVFQRDPDGGSRRIGGLLEPARKAGRLLGIPCKDILDDRERRYSKFCAEETCYLVVYTHAELMSNTEKKSTMRLNAKRKQELKIPRMADAAGVGCVVPQLKDRHGAIVRQLTSDLELEAIDVLGTKLPVTDALRMMRKLFDAEHTSDAWRPVLVGDLYYPMDAERDTDASHLFVPALRTQLASRDVEVDGDYVRVGKRWYGVGHMTMGGKDPQTFDRLFDRMSRDIPWRVAFDIRPRGLHTARYREVLVAVGGWMSNQADDIRRELKRARQLEREQEAIVALRVNVATWGDTKEQVQERMASLVSAIQGWGVCDVTTTTGDPIMTLLSTIPGMSIRNIAPGMLPPLRDAVRMLPLSRPASPWAHGAVLFRTPDGKVFPYQPGSSITVAGTELIFAPMGAGKSVLLNTLGLSMVHSPGLAELPLQITIDFAWSSRGRIDVIKDELPEERRSEAAHFRLRNEADYRINPFDTTLGCRYPSQTQRQGVIHLLTEICTPVGATDPIPNASDIADLLVMELYRKFSDHESARKFQRAADPSVTAALAAANFQLDKHTTYWEVVDFLFQRGDIQNAIRAQRFAVPNLTDVSGAIRCRNISDLYLKPDNKVTMPHSNESVVDAMDRLVTGATHAYPVVSGPTAFDIGNARVVALDLAEVAPYGPEGSPEARQAAIVMCVVGQYVASRFYLNPETADELVRAAPACYHSYLREYARETFETPKYFDMDEVHRAGGRKAFQAMLQFHARESRKFGVKRVAFASQMLEDFSPELVKLSSSIFVLSSKPEIQDELKTRFKLTDSAIEAAKRHVRGRPGPDGAAFLAVLNTSKGQVVQVLMSSPGAVELFALTTDANEVALRTRLYKSLGPGRGAAARLILARRFPDGQAVHEIEARRLESGATQEEVGRIIDDLAAEIIRNYGGKAMSDAGHSVAEMT